MTSHGNSHQTCKRRAIRIKIQWSRSISEPELEKDPIWSCAVFSTGQFGVTSSPILRYSTFFVLLFWFPCCPLVSSLPSIVHRIPDIIVKKNVLLTNDIPNCTLEYSSLALGKVRVQVTQAQHKTRKLLSLFGRGLSAKDFDVTNWTVLTMGTWNFQLLWRDIDFTSWLHCGEN